MADYGAWAGLGNALTTGVDAYSRAKKARADSDMQAEQAKRQAEQDAMTKETFGMSKQTFDRNTQEATPTFDADPALGLDSAIKLTRGEAVRGAEKRAEIGTAKELAADTKKTKQNGAYENQFRDEYNQLSKSFQTIVPMFKNIKANAENPNPTAASDMGLIFSYMKILDPNSTVREGEYATAANAGSIPDATRNLLNKATSGEKLQPEQRTNFLNSAKAAFNSALAQQDMHSQRYTDLAKRQGVNPENVVYDYARDLREKPKVKHPPEMIQQANEALLDPFAPPEVKAKAKQLLSEETP